MFFNLIDLDTRVRGVAFLNTAQFRIVGSVVLFYVMQTFWSPQEQIVAPSFNYVVARSESALDG